MRVDDERAALLQALLDEAQRDRETNDVAYAARQVLPIDEVMAQGQRENHRLTIFALNMPGLLADRAELLAANRAMAAGVQGAQANYGGVSGLKDSPTWQAALAAANGVPLTPDTHLDLSSIPHRILLDVTEWLYQAWRKTRDEAAAELHDRLMDERQRRANSCRDPHGTSTPAPQHPDPEVVRLRADMAAEQPDPAGARELVETLLRRIDLRAPAMCRCCGNPPGRHDHECPDEAELAPSRAFLAATPAEAPAVTEDTVLPLPGDPTVALVNEAISLWVQCNLRMDMPWTFTDASGEQCPRRVYVGNVYYHHRDDDEGLIGWYFGNWMLERGDPSRRQGPFDTPWDALRAAIAARDAARQAEGEG